MNFHLRQLVANISEKSLTFLDPYKKETDTHRVFNKFELFKNNLKKNSSFEGIKNRVGKKSLWTKEILSKY